jgi:hypothetical protein
MQAPFPIQSRLTGITLTYKNGKAIADSVLPRIGVPSPTFKYQQWTREEGFNLPNTRIGRKGKPDTVDFSATETETSVFDEALDAPIPYQDIEVAKANGGGLDPKARAVEEVTDLLALRREYRTAALVFGAGNYPAANKATLAGNDQWNWYGDAVNPASDPIGTILAAFDTMLVRPNKGVIGRAVATKLQQHPRIAKAFNANSGDSGVVPLSFIAKVLELDELLVGDGWYNTAAKGQAAALGRVWGKFAAFLHINPQVQSPTSGGVTFGFTGEWGNRVAGEIDDPDIGMRGGTRIRVGESVREVIAASDAGYLFSAAVA